MKVFFTGIHPEKPYYRAGVERNHLTDRLEMILDIKQDGVDLSQFTPYLKMATSDLATASKDDRLAVTAKNGKLKIEYTVPREITALKRVDFQLQFENDSVEGVPIWQTAPFTVTFYPTIPADGAIEYLYPPILSEHGARIAELEESKLDKQETETDETFLYGYDKDGQTSIELKAASIPLDTAEFEDSLSEADDTVQKAFNTLDKAIKSIDSEYIINLFR
jgi:hypothetical protein